ncbi:hypothetical protein Tco_0213691 [Tanacetum coccineum]
MYIKDCRIVCGREEIVALEVPALKNSSYRGPKSRITTLAGMELVYIVEGGNILWVERGQSCHNLTPFVVGERGLKCH